MERRLLRGLLIGLEAIDQRPQTINEVIDPATGIVRRICEGFPLDRDGKPLLRGAGERGAGVFDLRPRLERKGTGSWIWPSVRQTGIKVQQMSRGLFPDHRRPVDPKPFPGPDEVDLRRHGEIISLRR